MQALVSFFLSVLLLLPYLVMGQFLVSDSSTPVYQNGNFLTNPWAGGLNQPQASIADFDQDGAPELLLYDRNSGTPTVYSWSAFNSAWEWLPNLGGAFPRGMAWMLTTNLNCDHWPDLLLSASDDHVEVWLGNGPYSWELAAAPLLAGGNPVYVLNTDIPAVGDVDNDGDIDILSFNPAGTQVVFYEQVGSCDSLAFVVGSACWGQFAEGGLNSDIYLNTSCLTGGGVFPQENGAGHAGSSLGLADIDGDGLQDVVIGDLNQNTLVYLHNGGVAGFASMDAVQKNYPTTTQSVNLRKFPAPYFLDLDQDGDLDMLAVPNDAVAGRNADQCWYYQNQSSGLPISLQLQSQDFLVGDMIDLGERSHPALADVNGDGLPDLIVGNYALRNNNQGGQSGLALFQNTGTAQNPAFDLVNNNWLDLGNLFNPALFGIRPAFGDIDGDGDQDLVLGDQNGNLHVLINSAGAGNAMQFSLQYPNLGGIDLGEGATPTLADLNRDGLVDLIAGNEAGQLTFWGNESTLGSIEFTAPLLDFGQLDFSASGCCSEFWVPFFSENNLGEWELFLGTKAGNLVHIGNIEQNLQGSFTVLDTSYGHIEPIPMLSPIHQDLNNDGNRDWLMGTLQGGIRWFAETSVNSVSPTFERKAAYKIWVNEESQQLEIAGINPNKGPCNLIMYSLSGGIIYQTTIIGQSDLSISMRQFPQGLYVISIFGPEGRTYQRILLSK
ncbi:MAG: T9SS type A sorting domain-containing protein [Bacteroidia bacterium]|nr:T9SS type A sorting domain-containing protein [Bacteroidia bacterium]